MIPNFETLTSISQDLAAGTITYVDEAGTPTVLNIAALIAEHETNTTLGLSNGILSYTNENATNLPINLVSTDLNNAITTGADGALFADRATLALEPWFVQGTTDKATLNTDDIYQMGRVGINKQNADKQLDVNGDFRTLTLSSDGKFHGIEVNHLTSVLPSTYMFVGNAQNPFSSQDMSLMMVQNGETHMFSQGTTGQNAFITTAYNLGIRFSFSNTSGLVEGTYIFPRNGGLPNQILVTDGNISSAHLQWADPQTVFNVNAHNGLQGGGSDVILGGPLDMPTTILTNGPNTLAVQGLQTSTTSTDKVVVTDTNGILKNSSGAMPKFFYMPAITFDTSIISTGLTRNLYQEYVSQFTNVAVRNTSAPANIAYIPISTDLNYYVTYFDPAVFANLSIDDNGILTYDVIDTGTTTSYLNIVFALK